jgi:hypothetical protein
VSPDFLLVGLLKIGQGPPGAVDLTPEEEARWRRMAAPQRAAQYLAGRWLLRHLCARHAGVDIGSVRLNAEGAPHPAGPPGVERVRLSLSHSGEWVAATACRGPSGIDVERWGGRRDWPGLARTLGLPQPAGEAEVLRAWTEEEARFKAGEAPGLALWRFEGPDFLGCLLAPRGLEPDVHYFGAAVPVAFTAGAQPIR